MMDINKPKLTISNMYRAKNKISFFAMHQAITRFSEFDIEFHILWDDPTNNDDWADKIDNLPCKVVPYTIQQLNQYCLDYGISQDRIDVFERFKGIYFIIHAHYLRHHNIDNYYLIYDDDIYLKEDLDELKFCLANRIPCLIHEPMNAGCDKVLIQTLLELYQGGYEKYREINPQFLGFNAGFQGIGLEIYDDFQSPEMFSFLINLFNFRGFRDENGKEIKMTPAERGALDTQQQSFFSIMNIIRTETQAHILSPDQYYVCANWGYHPTYGPIDHDSELDGWEINLRSKVVHFIGHAVLNDIFYGKAKVFHNLVDDYLKERGFLI
jgi:hypothetical protein